MTGAGLLGLCGTAELRIIGACPEDFLGYLAGKGVRFRHYRKEDELTACLVIPCTAMEQAEAAAKRTMCELQVVRVAGVIPGLRAMGKRLGLLGLMGAMILLVVWLQGHILFFRVEGNETLPDQAVLSALEDCGVGFFTSARGIDLDALKNEMIARLPQLSFVTVNVEGCEAVVVVRQREEKPKVGKSAAPANILAEKAGIITEVTATGGTPQVKTGDLVTSGQLLISGVTNLDKTLMLSRAEGEVYARTWTPLDGIIPKTMLKKQYTGRTQRRFAVTFGKKTIKFYKTSGISYGNYDKMATEKPLTLPGGYVLPVKITVMEFREYEPEPQTILEAQAEMLLQKAETAQLELGMTAGKILSMQTSLEEVADAYRITGTAECQEEIGTVAEIKD